MIPIVESIVKQPSGYHEVGIMFPPNGNLYIYKIANARIVNTIRYYIKKGYTNRIIELVKHFPYRKEGG